MRDYRLLIVDDDAVDRRLYCKLLATHGTDPDHIEQAATGAAGLAALRTKHFDCVLLDFSLPDMSGTAFLDAAMTDGELPCAVVLVTGHGTEAIAVEAMKRGAQDYLVKDQVNIASLWRALTRAVDQMELRQRLNRSLLELTASNQALEREVVTRKAAEDDLRSAKNAAEQANEAKTRFVAMVTHELRTPLNGVLGYGQLLRLEGGLSARQSEHVGAMMQAGQHLLAMIERVLDFATIENGRMELHPEEVSVRELTEGCIAFISPMARERGLSLRVVHAHDTPRHIVADPARLRQVMLNLLGNAVKYTDSGSVELRLLAGALPGGLRVEIADTGRGIKEVSRHRLFQVFERLEAATSLEGTGLGLAISARIVRLMGGTINHIPNPTEANPGGGSIFWFECPTIDHDIPAAQVSERHAACSSSGRRILLVDDIKINRDIIGAFLERAGHAVVLAQGGQEAVQLAGTGRFDLILMDIRMPEMDGMEATRRIRALPGCPAQVPILALTAYTFPNQVAQCLEAGMNGHVAKPVDYDTLMRAIDGVINPGPEHATADAPAAESPASLDRAVLDKTLAFLPPETITDTLLSLRERKEEMVTLLDRRADPRQQSDAAHALASSAGVFGFAALSTASRRFELAVAHGAPEADGLASELRTEAVAALCALDALMRENPVAAT